LEEKQKRINSKRAEFLTGREFPASVMSNLLELWEVIPLTLLKEVDSVRGFRNKIVHALGFSPANRDAALALRTAQEMIKLRWSFTFVFNDSFAVNFI
jgi:hypothetical protein